jgi:hypothetical protein
MLRAYSLLTNIAFIFKLSLRNYFTSDFSNFWSSSPSRNLLDLFPFILSYQFPSLISFHMLLEPQNWLFQLYLALVFFHHLYPANLCLDQFWYLCSASYICVVESQLEKTIQSCRLLSFTLSCVLCSAFPQLSLHTSQIL